MIEAIIFDFGHTIMDELADRDIPLGTRPVKLMPRVLDVLPQIVLPMGIWANTRTAREKEVRQYLMRAGINKYFTWVVTSVDAGHRKPDSRFFDHALRISNLNADDVLFVGNQLNSDIQGAINQGIRCVWLSSETYRSPDDAPESNRAKPTYTIATLAELPGLLRELQR